MGGGPDKEHLLIVLWDPEPKQITAEIKRRFPYIDITYLQLALKGRAFENNGQDVPEGELS